MSNKNAKDGGGFGKPLGVFLALTSLTGHGLEPIEKEPGTLTEFKV